MAPAWLMSSEATVSLSPISTREVVSGVMLRGIS